MENTNVSLRITPRLIVGLAILTFGILWTLDNLGYVEAAMFLEWWPAVLIALGVARLFDRTSSKFGSFIFIFIGSVLLLDNLDQMDWDFTDFIPIFIALVGARLVWAALRGWDGKPRLDTNDTAVTNATAMLSGIKQHITSREYRGGEATAIWGGVELDLRDALPKDGEAVLDVFVLMGGVEVTIPDNWQVVGRLTPIMAGFEDKTRPPKESGPKLIIKGMAVMGGVTVKN